MKRLLVLFCLFSLMITPAFASSISGDDQPETSQKVYGKQYYPRPGGINPKNTCQRPS